MIPALDPALSFLRTAAAALALTALAGAAHAQETRIFVDDAGHEVEIPVAPQRIVSLRGEQFTAPLIELGAPIVGSSGRIDEVVNNGEPYVRGAYDLFDFRFENSDVAWVGSPNDPDLEAIAATEPDLILIPDWQTDLYDQLSVIAPTVVIGIWSNPMLERYRKVADAAGKLDVYEAGLAGYQAKLERAREVVRQTIGDPSEVSIAIAEAWESDLIVYRDYGAMSQALRDLGFSMPDLIAGIEEGNTTVSAELLPEIDADFLIGTYNIGFGQPPSERIAAWENLVPAWDEILHAPRNNQHFYINREPMRALSFRSLETTMEILLTHLATREFVPLGEDS
ncbi:ABC transporter substrate-binding protein [Pelagibacterium halotolerans]|uniref:ABC transporter substrate-binding protein n=1 Tax=Pelagibacterium halotolerans TaxID=531813 RepID=UPI0038502810